MIRLAIRTLRFRTGAFVGTFVAMVLGTAIVLACGGLMETGIRTSVPPDRLAGAAIVVTGDRSYHVPGTDESATLAERVRLDPSLVGAIAELPGVTMTQLLPPNRPETIDAIGVVIRPGTDLDVLETRIEAVIHGQPAVTLRGDERGLAEFPQALTSGETLIALAGVFGGMAILVAIFVVASMLGLSIEQRRQELALLRTIGATPRQVRRMIVEETLIVSVPAVVAGVVIGRVLGRALFERIADRGVVSSALVFRSGWVPEAAAVGTALVTVLVVAAVAGRRAARLRPGEALVQAELAERWIGPGRVVLALVFLAGGLSLAFVTATVMHGSIAASTAAPAVLLIAIGLALLGPGVSRLMLVLIRPPVRAVSGMAGELASLNTRARTVRLAGVVMPIVLATGMATAQLYLQTTQVRATERGLSESIRADAMVARSTGGFGPEDVEAVRVAPGVAAASAFVTSAGFVEAPHDDAQGEDGYPLVGLSGDSAPAILGPASSGSLADLRGNAVALTADHARALGTGVGGAIALRLGDGAEADLRVVALLPAREDFEVVVLPVDLLAAHTTDRRPSLILVDASPGANVARTMDSLRELEAGRPGVAVAGRNAIASAFAGDREIQAWVNYVLVGVIVAYTAIALVNTLVIATRERWREFGVQRLVGSTRGQVMRMMMVEAALVAISGIVLGTLASAATLVPFSIAMSDRLLPSGPIGIYLTIVGFAAGLTFLATLVPAWLATRPAPVEAAAVP